MRKLALGCFNISYLIWVVLVAACTPPEIPEVKLDPIVVQPSLQTIEARIDSALAAEHGIESWLAREIRLAATQHAIPIGLAFALVSAESDFTIMARSWAGALGLTQVMPETGMLHCALTPEQLYQPVLNLNCGFSYLAMMHAYYQDWHLALIAYNRGPTRTDHEIAAGKNHGTSTPYANSILASTLLDASK